MPSHLQSVKASVLAKFGRDVKVIERLATKPVTYVIEMDGKRATVKTRDLHNCTLASSLFVSGSQRTASGYRHATVTAQAKTIERATAFLARCNLADLFKASCVQDGCIVFTHLSTRRDLPIELERFNIETPDRSTFLRRATAWFRYKEKRPVLYLDHEWRRLVESLSEGRLTAKKYEPNYARKQRAHVLVCSRCGREVIAANVYDKKTRSGAKRLKCPDCDTQQTRKASQQSQAWLTDIERRFKIRLQTAASPKGEYRAHLSTSKSTCVDGYHAPSNTVFEYHGSRWHGNPLIYYTDETPSPYTADSALRLLGKTLRREQALCNAGFNLIRIWDQDFLNEDRYHQWLLLNTSRLKRFLTQQ